VSKILLFRIVFNMDLYVSSGHIGFRVDEEMDMQVLLHAMGWRIDLDR
jgi:hypothetical protein